MRNEDYCCGGRETFGIWIGIIMNKKYYTGIGSRETPTEILVVMYKIAKFLAEKGYTLRSGGADGADYHGFEVGCDSVNGNKEIYLPWRGFNESKSELLWTQEAWDLAATIHPVWDRLKLGAKQLHARNCHQVLGQDLKTPSLFLVCYTENGEQKGGTATALKLAEKNNVIIFNLGSKTGLTRLRKYCKTLK